MPADAIPSPAVDQDHSRSSCPPEDSQPRPEYDSHQEMDGETSMNIPTQQPTPPPSDRDSVGRVRSPSESCVKPSDPPIETPARDIPTPISATDDISEDHRNSQSSPLSGAAPTPISWPQHRHLSLPYPSHRFLPSSSSSLLRPGSRFKGNQTSDRQQYEVEVEIKYVDMRESLLCGYLRIKGLTEDHPSLTTYFEGEIIGSKYTFITQHPEWGSNEKVDRQHWARFPAYKPLSKYSSRPELVTKDWMQKEHLFMRWKEYFLVPDHRVKTINGASFEGFYYICFNQTTGGIEGIYFHAKSEKYQKLQLDHVPDHGCQGAIEFR
ncbi:unnamed protein product [Periconia digitata]|uniref:Vacuolar import and degradation protein n=1 Tax=Periconia digitata TaxID=1303443 RepID=A0A9W4U4C9_9PLEO|nr:unnamed protein product [Periconia digitata]